jgi:hypothetical protein
MKSNIKVGRLAGLLFLLALIPYVIGQMAILEPILYVQDYPNQIRLKRELVGLAIMLKWFAITAMVAFAVLVFPILREFGNRLAVGFLAIRFLEFGLLIMGSAKLLSLVSLSEKYMSSEGTAYEVLANTLRSEWYWIGFIYMFTFALHNFVFYYLLFKSKLVSRYISAAGFIASILILTNVIFGVMGLDIGGFYLFAPIGIVELILGVWLLIFGFREK